MKKCTEIIILICLVINNINAQQIDSSNSIEFVTPIEIQPKWVMGTNEQLIKEISSKIKYPIEQCIEGITVLQFTVDTLGQVINPKIKRSISTKIDEQLLNLIYDYEFEAGILVNRKAKFNMYLPIKIKLE